MPLYPILSPKEMKHSFGHFLKEGIKSNVRKSIHSLGYHIAHYKPIFQKYPQAHFEHTLDLDWVLDYYWLQNKDNFFFIQIGANDGYYPDPINGFIKKRHPKGILIEPQPEPMQRLQDNYKDERQLSFEQIVISNQDGTLPFYTCDHSSLTCLLASLEYDNILKNLKIWNIPDPESLIKKSEIPALTLETLMKKHGLKHLDFLQIDAEGHDLKIIESIPFDAIKPKVINFEYTPLSPKDQNDCWELLASRGYKLWIHTPDTTAILL